MERIILKELYNEKTIKEMDLESILFQEEEFITQVIIIITDCGTPQLKKVFNTNIEDRYSRPKTFKYLLNKFKNEIIEEIKKSEFPRLVVKYMDEGHCFNEDEYWVEVQ